jgi:phosphoenolpyruvate synthase/pyruvate phosphate dikinase
VSAVPAFDRSFFESGASWSRIGDGALGGKAEGLVRMGTRLQDAFGGRIDGMEISIPAFVVIATDVFDAFLDRNGLSVAALATEPDRRIAHAFQKADLPMEVLGDLRGLVEGLHRPLAVRSSSLLEDALEHPFAGIYETKMIPNNEPTAAVRFQRLAEAIKLVWASTLFASARDYRRSLGVDEGTERMAVVVQEIVGRRFGDRFYPHVSAVGRTFNYYPVGRAKPEEGVVSLALGLGKTIVDGGRCWSYSPRHPLAPPPFGSVRETLEGTQARFWAVNMGRPPAYYPVAET